VPCALFNYVSGLSLPHTTPKVFPDPHLRNLHGDLNLRIKLASHLATPASLFHSFWCLQSFLITSWSISLAQTHMWHSLMLSMTPTCVQAFKDDPREIGYKLKPGAKPERQRQTHEDYILKGLTPLSKTAHLLQVGARYLCDYNVWVFTCVYNLQNHDPGRTML